MRVRGGPAKRAAPVADQWTIRSVIAWTQRDFEGRAIETARLDAELLVAHALGIERIGLYLDLDRPLKPEELLRIRELVSRRRKREPIAYILGRREFWGRNFEVSPAVMIPRPDTETLVERALDVLAPGAEARVLDLCTGSGAIAVTLAAERPAALVDATDLSPEALEVAGRNAVGLGVADRVRVLPGDLFAALGEAASPRYALITANPPYIAESELGTLAEDVVRYEPRIALTSGDEGLALHRRIVREAPDWLQPGGTLLFEIGAGQAAPVLELVASEPRLEGARTHRDLAGIERVVEARAVAR